LRGGGKTVAERLAELKRRKLEAHGESTSAQEPTQEPTQEAMPSEHRLRDASCQVVLDDEEIFQMQLATLRGGHLPVPASTLNAITEVARQVTERAVRN
jgi:hypothetical protein